MSRLLDELHGGHVEAILGSVLGVLVPVDFLAHYKVFLILIEVVVDDDDLAISLPNVVLQLVGLESHVLWARGSQGDRLVIIFDDVVDLGATKEHVWADPGLHIGNVLVVVLAALPGLPAGEPTGLPVLSPGVVHDAGLVGVDTKAISVFRILNDESAVVSLDLGQLASSVGVINLPDDLVRLNSLDLSLVPDVVEDLLGLLVLASLHVDHGDMLGVDFLKGKLKIG